MRKATNEKELINRELFEAVERGDLEKTLQALDHGADPNTKRKGGNRIPALGLAADKGNDPIVRALLKRGANIDATDCAKNTPLMHASRAARKDVVATLLSACPKPTVNCRNQDGSIPLGSIAGNGGEEITRMLLDAGADIEAKDDKGRTPLVRAVSYGHIDVINTLLDRGANIETRSLKGYTPLFDAVYAAVNALETVQLLLRRGADVHAKDNIGNTALYHAAGGSIKIITALLEHEPSADVLVVNRYGETALFPAVRTGRIENVNLILYAVPHEKIEPFLSAKNKYGTAESTAMYMGFLEIAEAIRSAVYPSPPARRQKAEEKRGHKKQPATRLETLRK